MQIKTGEREKRKPGTHCDWPDSDSYEEIVSVYTTESDTMTGKDEKYEKAKERQLFVGMLMSWWNYR